MTTKSHSKSMSQTERGFWREAFLRAYPINVTTLSEQVRLRAEFADAAVGELRKRLTWGRSHD